jgi:putative MFS transporter
MDRLPATKYFYLVAIVAGTGVFFDLFDINTLSYTITALRQTLNLDSFQTSLTLVMVFIGMAIGSLFFGRIAEARGRKPMFELTILIIALGSFLMFLGMFWTNLYYIWFARLVTGFGIGGDLPVIWSYASELVPTRLRGRAFGIALLVGGTFTSIIGSNLASFLLGKSLNYWGYEFLVGALVAFVVFPLRLLLPESPRWYMSRGDSKKAEEVMHGIETRVEHEYGKPLPTYQAPKTHYTFGVQKSPLSDLFGPALRRITILMILWFVFYTLAFYGWQSFQSIFIVAKGYTVVRAASLAASASWFAPLGPILGFLLADRLERRHQLMIYASIAGIVALCVAAAPATDTLIIGLLILAGIALGAWTVPMYAFVPEVFPAKARTTGSGLTNAFGRASNVIGVMVVGVALASTLTGQLVWIAGNWVLCIIIMAVMGFRTTGRTLEDITESGHGGITESAKLPSSLHRGD